MVHSGHDSIMFPVHGAKLAVLPTFLWRDDADADTVAKVIELQSAIDRFARGDEVSDEVSVQEARNPFRVTPEPPSRLLGLSHYDFVLEPWEREVLTERLPLHEPSDEHVLLLNVASDFAFRGVFGDGGRLEVWIRRTDLAARRFDQVVSFMHSA